MNLVFNNLCYRGLARQGRRSKGPQLLSVPDSQGIVQARVRKPLFTFRFHAPKKPLSAPRERSTILLTQEVVKQDNGKNVGPEHGGSF